MEKQLLYFLKSYMCVCINTVMYTLLQLLSKTAVCI